MGNTSAQNHLCFTVSLITNAAVSSAYCYFCTIVSFVIIIKSEAKILQ